MSINPIDVLEHVLNLIVLYVILRSLIYKPVRRFMLEREERLAAEREGAQAQMEQALALKGEYEQSLKEAKARAEGLLKEGAEKAEQIARGIVTEAEHKSKLVLEAAEAEAERAREEALASLRDEVAVLSVEVAEKILGREVTNKDNDRIIEEYFSKVV